MNRKVTFSPGELHYLKILAKQYPTLRAASNEAIRLEAILNLPKGTEHFMSDIHGEHEAFLHILNSSSGEVREKLKECFGDTLSKEERRNLATLIYYPAAKLSMVAGEEEDMDAWYHRTLRQLTEFCRSVTVKHTRAKVRSYIPAGYTLIFNSRNFRMVSHQPFAGRKEALKRNRDIDNDSIIFETLETRMKVAQTDEGVELRSQVEDLIRLMEAYRSGAVAENHEN